MYIGPESIIEEQQEEQNNYTGQLILKVADEFEIGYVDYLMNILTRNKIGQVLFSKTGKYNIL